MAVDKTYRRIVVGNRLFWEKKWLYAFDWLIQDAKTFDLPTTRDAERAAAEHQPLRELEVEWAQWSNEI